jgi:amidase
MILASSENSPSRGWSRRVSRLLRSLAVAAVIGCMGVTQTADTSAPSVSGDALIVEKSVATLEAELARGTVTSERLTRASLARIAAIDSGGPALRSVIVTDPRALAQALRSDRRRAAGRARSALDGIPVLIKDNIESADGLATTGGSQALAANIAERNAPLVARLVNAGAIIIGKTNLSEWANFRSSGSISGWSAVGGLVKNPYALDRSACGSSSGTGAAIAASLAVVGIGTETDGSITCPAAINGLVGLKPTVELVSRTGVIPISHHQDTPGPMGRSVADVAALLTVIAGSDPADPATRDADRHRRDYVAMLEHASLRGKRLGVLRSAAAFASPAVSALFDTALRQLRSHGAQIVELTHFTPNPALGDAEFTVLLTDFKTDLNAYLATTPRRVGARTLADLIRFDRSDPRELALFGQEIFEKAEATTGASDPRYRKALQVCQRFARTEGLDQLIGRNRLDAIIAPSYGPASRIDIVDGDNSGGTIASLAAIAGYPHLTVPMGYVRGLPLGVSFVGPAWSDGALLQLGAAYERVSHLRHPPRYRSSIEDGAAVRRLLAPPAGKPTAPTDHAR